jgi:creatinine amidohydrolase/Fe(II)-dependent formamide hydrolase-like protein
MALWQEGVSKVVMSNSHGTVMFDKQAQKIFETFVKMSNIQVERVDPDLSWLKDLCGVL